MSEPIHYAERNAHQCWTCKNRVGQVKHTISIANTDGIPSKLGVLLPECKIAGSGMWWVNECPCPDYTCAYEEL